LRDTGIARQRVLCEDSLILRSSLMAKIRSIMANPTLIFAARVLLVAVGYALAGRIGMMVASVEDYVTLL